VPHAIELYLDPVSETFVRRIWDDLLWAGLPSLAAYGTHAHRPHVSLSVCGRAVGNEAARGVSEALGESAVPIELSGVGTFPGGRGVVFLAVAVDEALIRVHRGVDDALRRAGIVPWDYYAPGRWVPHCTLAMGMPPERLGEAMAIALRGGLPLSARAIDVAVVDVANGATSLHARLC